MSEPRYPYVHVDVTPEQVDEISALLFELGAEGVEERDLGTLAKALGHPTRVRILRILRGGEGATVTGLVETLALAQSTVSEHLRLLREAGIVTIEAPSRLYRADIHRLRRLKALVGSL